MQWHIKPFGGLSTRELFEIYRTRIDVFVVEQNCAYPEADEADLHARHLFAEQNGTVAAYCRIIPADGQVKIGRVLVARHARDLGLGRELMQRALAEAAVLFPQTAVFVQAQLYLQKFYASLGFLPVSAAYQEDGIWHLDMLRPAEAV